MARRPALTIRHRRAVDTMAAFTGHHAGSRAVALVRRDAAVAMFDRHGVPFVERPGQGRMKDRPSPGTSTATGSRRSSGRR